MSFLFAGSFKALDGRLLGTPVATDAWPDVSHVLVRRTTEYSSLECYLEGWAEANLAKIFAATAPGYHFRDPLVGTFSRQSLHEYFEIIQRGLCGVGIIEPRDVAFFLSGPMDRPSRRGKFKFWREAPRIGLTGVSEIEVGEQGVIAEGVAYDLNLASDMLCRAR